MHAAGAAHVAVLHERQIARERRTPDQIDETARLARRRKVVVERDQVGERVRDLLLRERRVAGAGHRRRRIRLADARQRVRADELALAVEVGGNADGIRLLRKVLERADDVLLLGELLDGRIHQIRQRLHLPALAVGLHAVLGEGLALLERGFGKACRHVGGDGLAVGGHAAPAAALLVHELGREIEFEDMAAQADGHPLLAIDREAVDGCGIHLIGLGLA